jgi:4'-phosphopantetheinyl transferase
MNGNCEAKGPASQAIPMANEEWSLRLAATTQPRLRIDSAAVPTQGIEAIRQGYDAGAVQAVFLSLVDAPLAALSHERLLSKDEQEHAARLANPEVARSFVAGRWLLRSVLAVLTGTAPASVSIRLGERGKLFLADARAIMPSFNLSHSGDLVALALVPERRIGIDIEAKRPLVDVARLARRILTSTESVRFRALPEQAREDALFTAWTGKESVLKAVGTGIAGSPNSIEVLRQPGAVSNQGTGTSSGDPPLHWSLLPLSMPAGFYGSLAVEGEIGRLLTWQAVPTEFGRRFPS